MNREKCTIQMRRRERFILIRLGGNRGRLIKWVLRCDPGCDSGSDSVAFFCAASPTVVLAAALSYTRTRSSRHRSLCSCQPYPPARLARPRTPLRLLLCTITTRSEGLLLAVCWPRRTDSRNSRTAFRSDTRLLGRVVCEHGGVGVNLIHEKKVTKWELHGGNY